MADFEPGPRADRWLALLALAVALPSLGVGFYMDDWWHVLVVRTHTWSEALFEMFRFVTGPEAPHPLWWQAPDMRLAFFRPLPAALIEVDNALFGNNAWLWHLHQVGWWLVLVAVVRALFRGVLSPRAAFLATAVFAFDQGHTMSIAWLAGRNALVSAVFCVGALVAHVRWRRGEGRGWGALAVLAFMFALAGGESALGGLGYLLAWEVMGAPGPRHERALALAPVGLVVGAWAVMYTLGGFGTRASGMYFDPLREPAAWLVQAPGHLLALLGAATLRAPVDLWSITDDSRPGLVAAGVFGVALAVALLRELATRAPDLWSRVGWLLGGALLSLFPVLSTYPSSRLLLLPSVGIAAVIGALVEHVYRVRNDAPRLPWPYRWTVTIAALHAYGLGPVLLVGQMVAVAVGAHNLRAAVEAADFGPPARLAIVDVTPTPLQALYLPEMRFAEGEPLRVVGVLSTAPYDHVLRRISPRRLEVEVVGGHLFGTDFERGWRAPSRRLVVGDRVPWGNDAIEILAVDEVGPTRFAFESQDDLDDLTWLAWSGDSFAPVPPPALGQEIFVRRTDDADHPLVRTAR